MKLPKMYLKLPKMPGLLPGKIAGRHLRDIVRTRAVAAERLAILSKIPVYYGGDLFFDRVMYSAYPKSMLASKGTTS